MNRQTILLISDMRQVYLAEIMTKRGLNVRCLDIRNSGTVKEQLEKLKSFLAEADMLILPIPVTKIPEQKMLNDILNKNLTNDTLVLGGCFSTEQQELLERRDIHYLDFMKDEIVTEENAVATAEGVIKIFSVKPLHRGPSGAPGEIVAADARTGLVVACGDDDVELETIQMPGAKRMNAKDYLRGHDMQTAICLGKA